MTRLVITDPQKKLLVAYDPEIPEVLESQRYFFDGLARFADTLSDTGVTIKVNSIARELGYCETLSILRECGVDGFIDVKLYDVATTLENDVKILRFHRPQIVTVASDAGTKSMEAVHQNAHPDTLVAAITVLTHFTEEDVRRLYGYGSVLGAVLSRAKLIKESGLDCLVCAPAELEDLRNVFGDHFTTIVPNLRDPNQEVKGETQNIARSMTPTEAIKAGADMLVVGRPITQADSPRDAVMRILEEIDKAA